MTDRFVGEKRKRESQSDTNPPKIRRHVANCWTVAVTGLMQGDVIRGVAKDSGASLSPAAFDSVKGVVLKVHSGKQSSNLFTFKECARIYGDKLHAEIAKRLSLKPSVVEMRLNTVGCTDGQKELIGLVGTQTSYRDNGMRFIIMNPGAWVSEQVRSWACEGTPVSGVQIIEELKSIRENDPTRKVGELALRSGLFELAPVATRVDDPDVDDDATARDFSNEETGVEKYRVEGRVDEGFLVLCVPKSQRVPITDDEMIHTLKNAFKNHHDDVDACWKCMSAFTAGLLKSAFQKCIRFGADEVAIGDRRVGSGLAAACAVALCLTKRGNQFIPELGQYVRGQTSAFKRIAVIMLEDAWPECEEHRTEQMLEGALAIALCSARVPNYNIPLVAARNLITLTKRCAKSSTAIVFEGGESTDTINLESPKSIETSSKLIDIVRSLKGDIKMFQTISEMNGTLRVVRSKVRHSVMPIIHIADHHVFRGVAHAMRPNVEMGFAKRFETLFTHLTGFNPRRKGALVDEQNAFVLVARRAQRCVMVKALRERDAVHEPSRVIEEREHALALDVGVLSGGVGAINVWVKGDSGKNESFQVVLGIDNPKPIVFRKITRDTKSTNIAAISDDTKRRAVAAAQSKGSVPFRSPMLSDYNTAIYVNGLWKLTSQTAPTITWSYDASKPNTVTISYSVLPSPAWSKNMRAALRDDELVYNLLLHKSSTRPSMVDGAKESVEALAEALGRPACLRMLSLIRQRYSKIDMPVPSLGGGELSSDQLMVLPGDWDVWRAFVILCGLVPGVLAPGAQPPSFTIINSPLLRLIEGWIVDATDSKSECDSKVRWAELLTRLKERLVHTNMELKVHQQETIDAMLSRDEAAIVKTPGHYINMETGSGKTITALRYALEWCARYGGVERIVWITPQETVSSIKNDIEQKWGVRCTTVTSERQRMSADINIVNSSQMLRKMVDTLPAIAGQTFFVFDEVHTLYHIAKKTSVARNCARLCPKFVCMTATPLTGKSLVAGEWLADTCGFPVTRQNEMVAAARMFSAIVVLPIERIETIVSIDPETRITEMHRSIERNWESVACAVRQALVPHVCDVAIEKAKHDRAKYPEVGGGVLLAANSNEEAEVFVAKINARLPPTAGFHCGLFNEIDNKEAGIVVVTMNQVLGYNAAVRLGVMVTGVYASSAASRHQLRGRLYRLPQVGVRDSIEYITVVMRGTILDLLHERHSSADGKNMSLQEAGKLYMSANG